MLEIGWPTGLARWREGVARSLRGGAAVVYDAELEAFVGVPLRRGRGNLLVARCPVEEAAGPAGGDHRRPPLPHPAPHHHSACAQVVFRDGTLSRVLELRREPQRRPRRRLTAPLPAA